MSLINLVKKLLPPILLDLYRNINSEPFIRYTWEGVYADFSEISSQVDAYTESTLVDLIYESTKKELNVVEQKNVTEENLLLSMLVSTLAQQKKCVNVLDFGGGMGISYIHLVHSIEDNIRLNYYIVENDEICKKGETLHSPANVHFLTSLPSEMENINIIYINSALQYIEDYRQLLCKLCELRPDYILFVRLSAGDIPTFVTVQRNLPNSSVPYRFINLTEIVQVMELLGYKLILRGVSEREYDQSNFPPSHRLGRTSNLLFTSAGTHKRYANE